MGPVQIHYGRQPVLIFKQIVRRSLVWAAAFLLATSGSNAADKKPQVGWDDSQMQQPSSEAINLNAYNAIREEGLQHSHVMDYAGGLMDGIGPRLTGSPNMAKANAWTRDQLSKMGCVNAHLEDWGEFGMGWQQLNTWVRIPLYFWPRQVPGPPRPTDL
jgi:hypothetical protein